MMRRRENNNRSVDIPFDVFQWSKYVIAVLSFLLFVAVVALFFGAKSYIKLYKQKEKIPAPIIYQVDQQSKMIVRIEEGDLLESKQTLLRSYSMRQYVFNREVINHLDELERWAKVKHMSSSEVWNGFAEMMSTKKNPNSPMLNEDFTRSIEIVTDYPLRQSSGVHRVEFIARDTVKGKARPPRRFTAVIEYDDSDAEVSYEDRFLNIDGVEIVSYQVYQL